MAGNIGDVSDPQQQEAATTIQAAVRGQQAREGVSEEKSDKEKSEEDNAAVKIQAAYRGYEARKRVNLLKEGEQNEESRTEEKTEEIDIDLNDPEVEKAATMIQKSYRGFHVRKSLQSDKDNPPEAPEPPGEVPSEESPPEAAHPVEEKTTQEETAPSEEKTPEEAAPTETTPEDKETAEEIDIDLTDPEVEKAALKIQGGFRGLKVRKEMKEMKEKDTADKEEDVTETEEKTEEQVEETEKTSPAEEEIDIDLNDPEVGKAALKIQAGFRGYKDRKNFKNDEKGKLETVSSQKDQYQAESSSQVIPSVAGSNEMFSHIDASDPQVNLAASKIQAGFKGMMVRNQLHRLLDSVDTLDVKLPLSTKESLVTKPDEVHSTAVSISSLPQGDTAVVSIDSETMSTVRKILEQIVARVEELISADGGSENAGEEMKREEQEWKDQTTGTEEMRKSVMKLDEESALEGNLDTTQDKEPLLEVETVKTGENFDVLVEEEGTDTLQGADHSVQQDTIKEVDISIDGKQMETDVHREKRGDTLGSQQSSFSFLKGIVSYIAEKVSSVSGTEQRRESGSSVIERKCEVDSTETAESSVLEKAMDIPQEEELELSSREAEVRDTRGIGSIDETAKVEGKHDTIDIKDAGDRGSDIEYKDVTMDNESVGERKTEIEGKSDNIGLEDEGDQPSHKEGKDETIDGKDVRDTESKIKGKEDFSDKEDVRPGMSEAEVKEEAVDEKDAADREAEIEGKIDTIGREDVGGGTSEIESKEDFDDKEDVKLGIPETEVKEEAIDEKDAGDREAEIEGKSDTIGGEDVGGKTSERESKEDFDDKEGVKLGIPETEVKEEATDGKDAGGREAEIEGKSDTFGGEDEGGKTSEIESKEDFVDKEDVKLGISETEVKEEAIDEKDARKAEIEDKSDTIGKEDVADKTLEIEIKEDFVVKEDVKLGISETEVKEEAIDEKDAKGREAEIEDKSDTIGREDVGGKTPEIKSREDSIDKEDVKDRISEEEVKDDIDEKDVEGREAEIEGKGDTIGREDVGGGTSVKESKEDSIYKEDVRPGISEAEFKEEAIDEKDVEGRAAEIEDKGNIIGREDVGGGTSVVEISEDSFDKAGVRDMIAATEMKAEDVDQKSAGGTDSEIDGKEATVDGEDVADGTSPKESKIVGVTVGREVEDDGTKKAESKRDTVDGEDTELEKEGKEDTTDTEGVGDGESNIGIRGDTIPKEVVGDTEIEKDSMEDTIDKQSLLAIESVKKDKEDKMGIGGGESKIGSKEDTFHGEVLGERMLEIEHKEDTIGKEGEWDRESEKKGKVDTIYKQSEIDTEPLMDSRSDTIGRKDVTDDTSGTGSKEDSMDKEDVGDTESKKAGKEDSRDKEGLGEKQSEREDKEDTTGKENVGDGMLELGDKEYTIDKEIVVDSELEKGDKGDTIDKGDGVDSKSEIQGKEDSMNEDVRHKESGIEGKCDAMGRENAGDETSETECKEDSINKEGGELEPDRQDKGSTIDKEDVGNRESEIDKGDSMNREDEVIGTLTIGGKDDTIGKDGLGEKKSELEGKGDRTVRKEVGDGTSDIQYKEDTLDEEDVVPGTELGVEGKVDTIEKDLGDRESGVEGQSGTSQYYEKDKCGDGDAKEDADRGGEVLTSKEEVKLETTQPAQEEEETGVKAEAGNKDEGIGVERSIVLGEKGADADNGKIVSATGDKDNVMLETVTGRRAHGEDEEGGDVECIHDVGKSRNLDGEDTAEGKEKTKEMNVDNSVDLKDDGRKVDESETTKEGIAGEEVVVCDEEKDLKGTAFDKVSMKDENDVEGDLVDTKELTNGKGKIKDAGGLVDDEDLPGEGKDEMGGESAAGDEGKNIVKARHLETKVNGGAQDNTGNEIVGEAVGGITQRIEEVNNKTEMSDEQIHEKSLVDTADVLEKEGTDQFKEDEPVGKQSSIGREANNACDEGRETHGTGLSQTVGLSGSKNSDLVNPEVIDIDLNDPEVQGAALKIQKGFKRKTQGRQNRKQGGDGYVQNANKDMNARKNITGTGNQVKDIIPGPSVGPVSHTVRPQEQRYNSQEKRVFSSSINIVPGRVLSSSHSKVLKRQVDPHKSINNKPEEVGDKLGENHGENKSRGTELTEETRINNEEEVDIDLTDPEVEKAALKIQNSFKGKFKKKAPSKGKQTLPSSKEMEKSVEDNNVMVPEKIKQATEEEIDIDLNDPEVEKAALKIQNSFKGKFKKKMGDKTTEDEGNGNFKFLSKTSQSVKNQKDVKIPLEEEIDIDLNDPDVEKAALKIQSSFKGKFQKKVNRNYQNLGTSAEEGSQVYKGRIKVQGSIGSDIGESELGNTASLERKPNEVPESVNHHKHLVGMGETKVRAETEVDIYLTDPEVQRAAIHNQAGYKGFQKRKKEVKESEADDKGDGEDAGKEEPDTKEEDSKDDEEKEESKPKEEEEEVDIDLTDPEVEQAAIKIQAGFKTMMNKKKKTEEDTAGDADNAATTEAKEEEGTSEEAPVTANEEEQPSALPVEGEPTTEEDVPPVSEEVAADTTPADTTGGGSPVVAEATPAEEDGNVETAEGDGNAATTEEDGNAATTEGDGKEATTEDDGNAAATEGDGDVATTEEAGQGDEKAAASSDEVPAEAEPTPMEGTGEEKPEEGTDEKPNDA